MKKVLGYFFSTILMILIVVYIFWSRETNKKWLAILIPFAFIAICIIVMLIIANTGNKKEEKDIVKDKNNPILGELKYTEVAWKKVEKEKITLWTKTYELPVNFAASSASVDVSEQQLASIEIFRKMFVEQKKQIEEMIMYAIECKTEEDSIQTFIPTEIMFSQEGKCALFFQDPEVEYNEDVDTEFGLMLLPKMELFDGEDVLYEMLSGEDV